MSLYLGTTPIAGEITGANTDLSNLTNTGKNIANWSNNVTNCITEIPQDIKLELVDGTLILKAGSKVYVPNGFEADGVTPKFDVVTVESDVLAGGSLGTFTAKWFFGYINGGFYWELISHTFSGSTLPTQSGENRIGYNTTTNKMQRSSKGGSYTDWNASFPLAVFSTVSGTITSIDQVFNGFGYIGSTVFALPGVKGLIPNGRNADGTLNNIEFTISKVSTLNTVASAGNFNVLMANNVIAQTGSTLYNEAENHNKDTSGPIVPASIVANIITNSSGVITSFTPKTAFHALDYNDSSTISGWSMPSSRYIDLTLLASGNTYKAPANGWVVLSTNARSSTTFAFSELGIIGIGIRASSIASSIEWGAMVTIPVKKGQTFWAIYGTTDSTYTLFRFIYAEGENV